ncbi:septum formation initiator family protein [Chlorobium sp. N1]|nr:septum formation initiator family protein [Chlorobium sp. N1]
MFWGYVRTNPKKFFFAVVAVVFLTWLLFDDYGLVTRISMEAEHRRLLHEQEAGQRRIQLNEERIRHAADPDSIEKAARERYNFRREGERLYIIRNE